MKSIAVMFRVLGWAWMLALVILGLIADDGSSAYIEKKWVAILAMVLATAWTVFTLWSASVDRHIRTVWFITTDWVIAFLVGGASWLAGTEELFHGGYPMSWVLVAAYAGGTRWALPGAVALGLEQWFVRVAIGRSASAAAFAVVFPVLGIVAGRGFDSVREHSFRRSEAERALAESEAEQARLEERARLAGRLHDSVLQTLHAIRLDSSDADQVQYLARRQERELKRTIDQFRSPHADSFRVALLAARDDVEDLHRVEIEAMVKGDTSTTERLAAVVEAAREAMINAAKHSGADSIDLFSDVTATSAVVIVRDRGSGFAEGEALGGDGHGLSGSLVERVEDIGGSVEIKSAPGEGTEITIRLPV